MKKDTKQAEKITEFLKMVRENQITTVKDKRKFFTNLLAKRRKISTISWALKKINKKF